jgi:beta-glucosidase
VSATEFDQAVARVRAGGAPEREASRLYQLLDDGERLGLLHGDTPFWAGMAEIRQRYGARPYVHGAVARLGIPGIRFVDGPRGCVAGEATAFPVPMARGATWDPSLEERVGEVIGREVRAQGGNFIGAPCINLPRHPAWGRVQETYGDDPYHLGEFGAAMVRGLQRHVMACAKHYALNSMENARFTVDVRIDERDLHDIYLPHFKRTVEEGVAGIMSAYNAVNGEYAGQNRYLLTRVLREYWGWQGITVSDFVFGLRDAAKSLEAGLDLEEPFAQIRATHLKRQLAARETSWLAVERAGVRLLTTQLRSHATRVEGEYDAGAMAAPDARALAREVAGRAMVLLKNDPVEGVPILPLSPTSTRSIALIGRLAATANMGDRGSSLVHSPSHVTPLQGLEAAFPEARIQLVSDDDPKSAAAAASDAQVAIVVVGYDGEDEGEYMGPAILENAELMALFPPRPQGLPVADDGNRATQTNLGQGGDRTRLTLRPVDEAIIRAVIAANPCTVVVMVAAGAVITEAWRRETPAILMMWYAGMEGGHALADILTGARNPSGRLPFSMPKSADHLPFYDREATRITYDRFHGQRLLDRLGVQPAFPHGYGLAYTRFEIRHARVSVITHTGAILEAQVVNTGSRSGRHVVQVYGRRADTADDGFTLLGFAGVDVPPEGSASVEIQVSFLPLARWSASQERRIMPASDSVELEIGAYARDPAAVRLRIGPT